MTHVIGNEPLTEGRLHIFAAGGGHHAASGARADKPRRGVFSLLGVSGPSEG